MAAHIVPVTDASFESDVLASTQPVLVDFWAVWSGPCRSLIQYLEPLAVEFADRVRVVRMDVDANQRTAQDYRVRSAPTLLLFKDGKPVDQLVGSPGGRANLTDFLTRNLGPAGLRDDDDCVTNICAPVDGSMPVGKDDACQA